MINKSKFRTFASQSSGNDEIVKLFLFLQYKHVTYFVQSVNNDKAEHATLELLSDTLNVMQEGLDEKDKFYDKKDDPSIADISSAILILKNLKILK
ncbi:hypothetical protein [Enterococcus sp. AZ180]|uniref:hypothetical protein n=1 Tax=Enterococcus sp. AZ180 TaxID=2774961 RepID=UPI003F2512C2